MKIFYILYEISYIFISYVKYYKIEFLQIISET